MKESIYNISTSVNLTVALVSDLHHKQGTDALRSLRQFKPDIITIVGDIVMGLRSDLEYLSRKRLLIEKQKNVIPFLESCVNIAPTFMSLGNHEWILSDKDTAVIEFTGVNVLDNRYVECVVNNQKIIIGGISSVFIENYREFRNTQTSMYPMPPKGEKAKIKIQIVVGFQSLRMWTVIKSCFHITRNTGG